MLATIAEAHREWHANAGIPVGTPGCPQDACHPIDDYDYDEPTIRCGHCKDRHYDVAGVRACAARSI